MTDDLHEWRMAADHDYGDADRPSRGEAEADLAADRDDDPYTWAPMPRVVSRDDINTVLDELAAKYVERANILGWHSGQRVRGEAFREAAQMAREAKR